MSKIVPASLSALLAALAFAVETEHWTHCSQEDFQKATITKLSLRSDGRLRLAPVLQELHDASTAYLWAVAEDAKGNVYFGGGSPGDSSARLFLLDGGGKARVLSELPELQVQAIALDPQGRVYAATSPDGKVYRVNASGQAEVFYDPRTKYIWAMAFNASGDLLVATGDAGEIHRVTPDGKGSVFFRTQETHARSLAVDAAGNLLVGTEPSGLILRVDAQGKGFVLYQAPKREVTALAVHKDGSIYAAVAGTKTAPVVAPEPVTPPAATAPPGASTAKPGAGQGPATPAATPAPAPIALSAASVSGGSEIYRIHSDGYPQKVWENAQEIVYCLVFDNQGRLVFGTGNRGGIYRLDSELLYTQLANVAPTQVTGLFAGVGGRILLVTGNVGKLYRLGPELEREGSLQSTVQDAGFFSTWGRLRYEAALSGGSIRAETRSGNQERPENNWSDWQPVKLEAGAGRIISPSARFLQYKLTVAASTNGDSPELRSVDVAFLPKNVRPLVELIEITPPNYRFPPQPLSITPSQNLTLSPLSRKRRPASPTIAVDSGASTMQPAKGYLGARWLARDPNDDPLRFRVEIRGVQEQNWKLLKDDCKERNLSWDSALFPDGEYLLKVIASDAPGNPPAQALSAELVSDPFVIDNTPPAIAALSASRSGGRLMVRFSASDKGSNLAGAEYSVNGGDWKVMQPTTRLTDSPTHDYELTIDNPPAGELVVAVKVSDAFDNQAVEKLVVR